MDDGDDNLENVSSPETSSPILSQEMKKSSSDLESLDESKKNWDQMSPMTGPNDGPRDSSHGKI